METKPPGVFSLPQLQAHRLFPHIGYIGCKHVVTQITTICSTTHSLSFSIQSLST